VRKLQPVIFGLVHTLALQKFQTIWIPCTAIDS
jgi:hypothetical protein